jgi:hypothetical protein
MKPPGKQKGKGQLSNLGLTEKRTNGKVKDSLQSEKMVP